MEDKRSCGSCRKNCGKPKDSITDWCDDWQPAEVKAEPESRWDEKTITEFINRINRLEKQGKWWSLTWMQIEGIAKVMKGEKNEK